MTTEQLEKANKLLAEKEFIKKSLGVIKDKKQRHRNLHITFDSCYPVYIPDDVQEFAIGMIELSYEKRLKEIEKEFEEL